MTTIQLDPLFMLEYMNWANDRVLDGARQLTSDQLHTPIRSEYLSPLGLLVHIMAAERIWLSRWQGESPRHVLTTDDVPSLEALVAGWGPLREEMRAFVAGVSDASQTVDYQSTKGEPFQNTWWHLFVHVFNHGTEHRSQVALYLAVQGIDLGNLDLTAYTRLVQ